MSCHDPYFAAAAGMICAPKHPVLRRPSALIRAAKAGQGGWMRGRALRRLLGVETLPGHEAVLARLYEIEARLNAERLAGAASYQPARHVLVMIALLAEMRAAAKARAESRAALRLVTVPGKARPERRAG
ncbi:MAG: DUF6477 family protein [Paracoccus sp. (in: a-proteobacteria)]|nr:DUF6477 family protein [Paracoccus sp. (in: a-proteobacteria)]